MRIKLLKIGPGQGVVGGIATVIKALTPVLQERVDYFYVPMTKGRLHKGSAGKFTIVNLIAVFRQYVHFFTSLLRFRPDVIHLHTSEGRAWLKDTYYVLVARLFGVPFVLHVHAADIDRLYNKRPSWEQAYTRWVMNKAAVVIAVSDQWRQRLSQIVSLERVLTFRNCVDVCSSSPGIVRSDDGQVNILFLGSIGPRKGVYDLLEAAKQLKANGRSFTMWLAGYEEAEGELARAMRLLETDGLQDVCHLLGVVMDEQKNELLSQADIFTLPSYNEGLPIALLEAMSAGLPLVVSPVGGMPEVVKEGQNGFLVTAGDISALSQKLDMLIQDKELRWRMGTVNRRFAERELDVDQYVTRLVALYESLVSGQLLNNSVKN